MGENRNGNTETDLAALRSQQDPIGQDEIVIVVNKQTAWFDSMRKGETKSLLPTAVDFDDVATVTVSERDGDKDKPIGESAERQRRGPQPVAAGVQDLRCPLRAVLRGHPPGQGWIGREGHDADHRSEVVTG